MLLDKRTVMRIVDRGVATGRLHHFCIHSPEKQTNMPESINVITAPGINLEGDQALTREVEYFGTVSLLHTETHLLLLYMQFEPYLTCMSRFAFTCLLAIISNTFQQNHNSTWCNKSNRISEWKLPSHMLKKCSSRCSNSSFKFKRSLSLELQLSSQCSNCNPCIHAYYPSAHFALTCVQIRKLHVKKATQRYQKAATDISPGQKIHHVEKITRLKLPRKAVPINSDGEAENNDVGHYSSCYSRLELQLSSWKVSLCIAQHCIHKHRAFENTPRLLHFY